MDKTEFRPDVFIVPGEVMLDSNLKFLDTKVFGIVYWMEKLRDGKCTASNTTIGKLVNARPESVSRSLARLEEQGYITCQFDEKSRDRHGINTTIGMKKGYDPQVKPVRPTGQTPLDPQVKQISNTKENNKNLSQEAEEQIESLHRGYVRRFCIDLDVHPLDGRELPEGVLDAALAKYRLTPKRKSIAAARLKDAGYEMCKQAIANAAANPFNHGQNDRGWEADLYGYILRNYEQVEKLANAKVKGV